MKTRLLIIFVFGLLGFIFFSFSNAYAENVFLQDQGLNLSPEECQKRYDLFGTHPEPILDLAKFKAENHPAFLQLTEDQSYKLVSTGGSSSNFSEHCNTDLPSFSIHYAIGETSGPYTRIYINLDPVSYDVVEIRTMEIDSPWVAMPKSEKLPFYVINWDVVHMEGEYYGHDPPKPSQTFKIPYIANNGKVNHIDTKSGTITADVSFRDKGIFAVKIPRNYPYTDHNDSFDNGHFFSPFVLTINPTEEIFSHVTKTDCYYDVWMQVSGNKIIEVNTTIGYLQGDPNHGDSDVAEFCLIKTISDENTAYLTELSPYKQVEEGVSPYLVYCKDGLYFLVKYDGSPACVTYNTQTALWNSGWSDTSTEIYTKYATPKILDEFSSKLLSEKEALKVVQKFINETNLVLDVSLTNPDFIVTTSLEYVPSKLHPLVSVDPLTGLPTDIVSAELEDFYRTPNWYTEIQKDYLGMPSQRIENGNVAWEINYRNCAICHDYVTFLVDAITGKIINTHNIDKLFHISDVVLDKDEKLAPLDIASIENGRINLNPVDTCAWINIDRLTLDELNQRYPATFTTKSGKIYEIKFLSINDDDLEEMPVISELIRATHQIPFPLNGGITASKGLVENPDWNDYRDWYDQKKTEQFNLDEVRVKGFVYNEEYYSIGFGIC